MAQQFLDNVRDLFSNASPQSVVTVTNYPSGSAAALFQDSSLTVPLANPFVLENITTATGIPPFYAANGAYRVSVVANGEAIPPQRIAILHDHPLDATTDPTPLPSISALQALSTSDAFPLQTVEGYSAAGDGGGGQFIYVSTDTSSSDNGGTIIVDALARRWYRLYSGPLNILWFGGIANNNAIDNSPTIRRAVNAMLPGQVLYFPAGTYSFNSTIAGVDPGVPVGVEINTAGVSLIGDGKAQTILYYNYTDNGTTTQYGIRVLSDYVQIRNLCIQGNLPQATSANTGGFTTAPEGNRICGLRVVNAAGTPLHGFQFLNSQLQYLNTFFGYNLSGASFLDSTFYLTFQALQINYAAGILIQDCYFLGLLAQSGGAYNDDQIAVFNCTDVQILNNLVDKSGTAGDIYGFAHGIYVATPGTAFNIDRIYVTGNTVKNIRNVTAEASGTITGNSGPGPAIALGLTNSLGASNVHFTDNIIENCVFGMLIGTANNPTAYPNNVHHNIRVQGNSINALRSSFYAESIDNLLLLDNYINLTGTTPGVIAAVSYCTNCQVVDNTFVAQNPVPQFAVSFVVGQNNVVSDNRITGTLSASDFFVAVSSQQNFTYEKNIANVTQHLKILATPTFTNTNHAYRFNTIRVTSGGNMGLFGTNYDSTFTSPVVIDGMHNSLLRYAYDLQRLYGTTPPAAGAYLVGDTMVNTQPSSATPVKTWSCSTAGSPGIWSPVDWIVVKGVTASRPVLRAADVGVQYLDTGLAPNGEPIWWTGTLWVNSSGTSV